MDNLYMPVYPDVHKSVYFKTNSFYFMLSTTSVLG